MPEVANAWVVDREAVARANDAYIASTTWEEMHAVLTAAGINVRWQHLTEWLEVECGSKAAIHMGEAGRGKLLRQYPFPKENVRRPNYLP